MKKPLFTFGALIGAVGLVGIILAGMSGGSIRFNTPMLLLVIGLLLLLGGFFRGEGKE